jgi:hypothetical protein
MSHPDWVTIRNAEDHQEEIWRWVQQQRLADEARTNQERVPERKTPSRFYGPLLAFAGKKMVAWGNILQAKYSRLHTEAQPAVLATRK